MSIAPLLPQISGTVIGPEDASYDEARRVWNGNIDRRPALIVGCQNVEDVQAAVRYAVAEALEIAVRSGAHSMSGSSMVEGGMVVDVGALNQATVNPEARRVRIGGGALLADLDAATQPYGLAVPAGLVSHTGVAGLTLGGGMGWLSRIGGLTIDNLLSVQIVTADGEVRRAAADENPELFWAVRGGGGNFGVVTEFEFRLLEAGPMISFGLMFWSLEQGAEMLRMAREMMAELPRDMNIMVGAMNAPPAPFVPSEHQMQPGYALIVIGFGSQEAHASLIGDLRNRLAPTFDYTTPMPYVALQQMLDEANAWGFHCYDKGCYIEDLSDPVIEALTKSIPQKTSPLSLVLFYRLDGAFSEVGEDETAFSGGRSPRFGVFVIAVCPSPEMLPAEREWVRSLWRDLRPHSFEVGCYVNSSTDFDDDVVRIAYGAQKYDRLARIKAQYDPANVFHRNANIKPALEPA